MPSWTSRMAFRSSGSSEISVMSCASRASTKTEEAVSKASGTDGFFGLPAAAADPGMASRSTLQLVLRHPLAAGDEDLLDIGLRVARHAADRRAVDGRVAPTADAEPFLHYDALHDTFGAQPRVRFHGQEYHAHSVLAGRRQREAQLGALAREELVRDLDQDTRAVAGFRIAPAGAAMRQVDEHLDALDDDVVRFLALDVGHEADSAGIVLASGIVQSLGGW